MSKEYYEKLFEDLEYIQNNPRGVSVASYKVAQDKAAQDIPPSLIKAYGPDLAQWIMYAVGGFIGVGFLKVLISAAAIPIIKGTFNIIFKLPTKAGAFLARMVLNIIKSGGWKALGGLKAALRAPSPHAWAVMAAGLAGYGIGELINAGLEGTELNKWLDKKTWDLFGDAEKYDYDLNAKFVALYKKYGMNPPDTQEFANLNKLYKRFLDQKGSAAEAIRLIETVIKSKANRRKNKPEKDIPKEKKAPEQVKKEKPQEKKVAPKKTYKVQKGDNLWNIAQKHLGNGARWKEIFQLNKKKFKDPKNPNLIYPGQVFEIPAK